MAATGKTPILLYGSTTPTNVPSAGNLTNSSDGCEIAINVADKNLFFKDSTNAVNTVPIRQSSASSNGWLSSTDWSTFNSKISSQWVTSGSNIYYTTGKVGIGLANGSSNLEVAGTGANNAGAKATYEGTIKINESGGSSLATTGGLEFKCSVFGSGYGAKIYATDNGTLLFGGRDNSATWTQTAQMTTGGDFTLNTGNLVIGTSGKGIDFSATAGTGTSELLADYEEGTFTPTIVGVTSAGTATYSTQLGYYTKVGRQVTVNIELNWSGHTGTGNMLLNGLPYTLSNTVSVPFSIIASNLALTASNTLVLRAASNSTQAAFYNAPVGGGAITNVPVDAAASIYVSGTYFV